MKRVMYLILFVLSIVAIYWAKVQEGVGDLRFVVVLLLVLLAVVFAWRAFVNRWGVAKLFTEVVSALDTRQRVMCTGALMVLTAVALVVAIIAYVTSMGSVVHTIIWPLIVYILVLGIMALVIAENRHDWKDAEEDLLNKAVDTIYTLEDELAKARKSLKKRG